VVRTPVVVHRDDSSLSLPPGEKSYYQ